MRYGAWAPLIAALVGLGATGCAPHLATGGALRMERLSALAAPAQQTARLDARAVLSARASGGTLALDAAPTVLVPLDGTTAPRSILRSELRLAASERARLQPTLRLAAERGRTRAVDAAADALDPRPLDATLTTQRIGGELGLRFRESRRHALSLQLEASRNGGVGADAAALPSLTRSAVALQRRVAYGAQTAVLWRAAGESVVRGADAPWRSMRLDAEWSAPLGRRDRVVAALGVLRGLDSAGFAPRVSLTWRHAARPGDVAWEVSLAQTPELDRLDGSVRARRRARLTLESTRVSRVSFRGSLNALADASGPAPRRGLGGEVGLRQPLGEVAALDAELARVLLWEGQSSPRAESRLTVGLRLPLR